MIDERIKEDYDVWISDVECTENERRFFSQYPAENHPTAIGFYAGFRTAERLAKIEVLESLRNDLNENGDYSFIVDSLIDKYINDIKEANR